MQTVNIHEAKTHLSRFVDQAATGEEIVIARAGKPVARLVALAPDKVEPRKLGLGRRSVCSTAAFQIPGSACGTERTGLSVAGMVVARRSLI